MKKVLILILCLLLFCSACRSDIENPTIDPTPAHTDPLPTETIEQTDPPVVYSVPLIAVSMAVREYESGNPILMHYSYQDLHLTLEDPQVADAIAIDFLNAIDPESGAAAKLYKEASSTYTGQANWEPYTLRVFHDPMRVDNSILSMYGSHVTYNGNPRPAVTNSSLTYDLLTGQRLSLRSILVENYSADTLSKLLADALQPQAAQGLLYADYVYAISEMFSTNTPAENWYFSQTGLCFYFAPYDIAPYSTGTVIAEIPYDQLPGLLKDTYFPAERVQLTGNVTAAPFQSVDTGALRQFAEVILDTDGKEYLITTDGAVQNLRLQTGTWSADRKNFQPEITLFASMTLCSTDGLMLQLDDSLLSSLALTYESGDIVHTVPLPSLLSE